MNSQYTLNYRVMYYDTDAGGVVHNLAYLRWVEEARTKMAITLGMDYGAMAKEGRHLVLVSHEVHYHSPAFLADDIHVNTCLEKVEKSSMYVKTEIRRVENNKLCVSVRQRLALVQMPGRALPHARRVDGTCCPARKLLTSPPYTITCFADSLLPRS